MVHDDNDAKNPGRGLPELPPPDAQVFKSQKNFGDRDNTCNDRAGLGLKTGPGNFRQPLYRPNLTSTLPAQPWQNPKNRLFSTQKSPSLSLQPYRPTGHCPNASMAIPPLTII